jgi:hypothetical protein
MSPPYTARGECLTAAYLERSGRVTLSIMPARRPTLNRAEVENTAAIRPWTS